MDRFLNLPPKKRTAIISAGLESFGKNGYRKCSISDIARLAGIPKSMVFYYFNTKRQLYFYLIDFVRDTIVREIAAVELYSELDFFERIRVATDVKVAALGKTPSVVPFIKSFYFETDKEVVDGIKQRLTQGFERSAKLALTDIDRGKFKPGVDPDLVLTLLHNYTEGFMGKFQHQPGLDIAGVTAEFYRCLNMLRQNLYREEYL